MPWTHAQRLLAVRLDSMGDVLMTEPALRALKESHPKSTLTLLTSPSGAEAGELIECVDQVLVYESPWMKSTPLRSQSQGDMEFIHLLRKHQFDGAVIFTVFSQNPLPAAMLCYLADIPLRLSYCRENPYQLLTHWEKEIEPEAGIRHEVRRQLDLVAQIGCRTDREKIQIRPNGDSYRQCLNKLVEVGADFQRPYVVVHTGATAASRRYPPEQFAEAIRELRQRIDHQVFLTGTAAEKQTIHQIQEMSGSDCISLAGLLSLSEFAVLLESASLLISNNTGAVHLGAGVGVRTVDLYALTNPQHTPWMVDHRVLFEDVACKFCYKSTCPQIHNDCLRAVSPRRVVAAALELLTSSSSTQGASVYD